MGRVGWAGKGNRDFFGVPDPMPAIVEVPQSSGHLFAKPCLHSGVRGGGGAWKRGFCVLCHCFDEAVRETAPTLQSPFPSSWALPSPLPPHLSHPSLSLCPPTPGGAFPISPPGPPGEEESGGGCIALYGFIYNILKKIKNL